MPIYSPGASNLIAALAVVLSACRGTAPPTEQSCTDIQGTVWVAEEDGNSITVIDAVMNDLLTMLKGMEGSHNLQAAPDGKTVWAVSGHDALAL